DKLGGMMLFFFFSSRRRHTRFSRDWSSDVCSSDLYTFFTHLATTIICLSFKLYFELLLTHVFIIYHANQIIRHDIPFVKNIWIAIRYVLLFLFRGFIGVSATRS